LWATGQSEKTNPTTVKGKKQKAKAGIFSKTNEFTIALNVIQNNQTSRRICNEHIM
jgi:hypothetical protein